MKTPVLVGVILIVLSLAALAYQGITYTRHETLLDVGPLKATAETKEHIPLPPILGVVALAGGIALVAVGTKR